LPIVFLRYNPHRFDVRGQRRTVPIKQREVVLLRVIQQYFAAANRPTLTVQHLYYDVDDEHHLCIAQRPEFAPLAPYCMSPIIA
jgi:hypothetical protein